MSKYVRYTHHGPQKVWVREDLKGKHRDMCLCHAPCGRFHPDNRSKNCKIANAIFKNCVDFNLVTPVLECPAFLPPEDAETEERD